MLKRLFIVFLFITQLCNVQSQNPDYFLHTVERGQTVYSISKMYNVSIETIYHLNPGSETGIKIAGQLKIPQESGSYFYHTIQPKETLYSVSRKYQMKGEDILAVNPGLLLETFNTGTVIRIPTNQVTTPLTGPSEDYIQTVTNALLHPSSQTDYLKTVQVVLLLPFSTGNRMVEYYEGFLLALEEIKKKGISVHLQIYDIGSGTDRLPGLLQNPAVAKAHLIIGGLSDKQIKMLSVFSNENNIPYVIPFTSKNDEPLNYSNIYQINTPQSYLYSKVAAAFCTKYKNSTIIFHVPNTQGNKLDFIRTLQKELKTRNMAYRTIETENLTYNDLLPLIQEAKNNVFVPFDDSMEALSKLLTPLKTLVEVKPQTTVSLFGYPTWQVYSAEYMNDFYRMNATFFSIFYADPTSPGVKTFQNNYLRWYSKELIPTYPKYGLLGYDTGMFFIQLLNKYGRTFESNINRLNYKGIQTGFYFERVNNWGGFINTNFYLVNFHPNATITSHADK
jgi:LysM repeat protein